MEEAEERSKHLYFNQTLTEINDQPIRSDDIESSASSVIESE